MPGIVVSDEAEAAPLTPGTQGSTGGSSLLNAIFLPSRRVVQCRATQVTLVQESQLDQSVVGRLQALARWAQRPPPLTVYAHPPEDLSPSTITVLQDELAPAAMTEETLSVLPSHGAGPQRVMPKLRPTPKVRGRLARTPILVTADSSSETEGSPVVLLPGPGEETEIAALARLKDERAAERLRHSLGSLLTDAVGDGRLEPALRQRDCDSEVAEDLEETEELDRSLADGGGDVLPCPAPEDITEGMGVVPYSLPQCMRDGPVEDKPLLSQLEPMPTLKTKTDDGISSTCQPLPRETQGHGQGLGRRRKRQLSQLAAEAEATAGAKFRPVVGRSPFSPIQRIARQDVSMASGEVAVTEGHRRLEASTSGDSSESAGNGSSEASSGLTSRPSEQLLSPTSPAYTVRLSVLAYHPHNALAVPACRTHDDCYLEIPRIFRSDWCLAEPVRGTPLRSDVGLS